MNPPFELMKEESGLHTAAFHSMEVEFLRLLVWAIKARGYKSLVELGVAEGFSSWWLYQAISESLGRLYLVDPNLNNGEVLSLLHPKLQSLRTYRGTSEKFFTEYEKGKRFDFILIDGDHSYGACYQDFIFSREAISDQGMIVIHDTNYLDGVIRATRDLKEKFPGTWMDYPIGKGMVIYEPTEKWECR